MEVVNDTTTETKTRNRRGRGCRSIIFIFTVIAPCFICGVVLVALGFVSGYSQQFLCQFALSGSQASESLNCSNFAEGQQSGGDQATGQGEFPFLVADPSDVPDSADINAEAIFSQVNPSIVGVGIVGDSLETDQVIGSGFVVSESGLIATNQHVVSLASAEYFVKFDDSEEQVIVQDIYRDPVNDIAILQVDRTDLQPLVLGDSTQVRPGQPVIAIGNPLGQLSSTITSGIVSAVNREVNIGSDTFLRTRTSTFEDVIQTDAAINPGNSGGPLINAAGQVIGVNFATVQGADNLSFAIPSSFLRQRLTELNEFGNFRIPYLGVSTSNRFVVVDGEVVVGALVRSVDPEGGAADVLRSGDLIIAFNETRLRDQGLTSLIQDQEIGTKATLELIRGEEVIEVEVDIIERPSS